MQTRALARETKPTQALPSSTREIVSKDAMLWTKAVTAFDSSSPSSASPLPPSAPRRHPPRIHSESWLRDKDRDGMPWHVCHRADLHMVHARDPVVYLPQGQRPSSCSRRVWAHQIWSRCLRARLFIEHSFQLPIPSFNGWSLYHTTLMDSPCAWARTANRAMRRTLAVGFDTWAQT